MRQLVLSIICGLLPTSLVFAQCPVANSCTPGSAPVAAHAFGMGIYNVTVGAGTSGFTNPTANGASDGYQDYSCLKKATVVEGVSTAISVITNPNSDENVRVWLDLNNDGTFNPVSELIFSSNNAKAHSGNFMIPVSAVVMKNVVLRMRVSSDNNSSAIPTPCSTPQFGQVEDYGITVLPNLNKPATDFTVNNTFTCSPTVQFTNLVQNGATSYLWSFSDGTTSTLPNPSKTFATAGTYSVKLKACNANGCDSLTKFNYVTYHTNVPVAASCTPATASYCCGYGITKVTFATLQNTSQNGAAGYEDFTCTKSVTVEEGQTYPLALETNATNPQDSWVYIDYNNNGIFEAAEKVFTKLNTINPGGNITIGWGAVYHTALRMRIISDALGSSTGSPCSSPANGQMEDYTIIITPNTRKPIASFTTSFTSTCDSVINFTDTSQYKATSWTWNFGDGSPAVSGPNPTHRYNATGTYTVKLKVCNNIGCDSITKVNYMTVTRPCISYCPFVANNYNTNYISNFKLNTIDHTSGFELTHYGNYSNLATPLIQGNTYPLEITPNLTGGGCYAHIYIDWNQDGDFFDPNEMYFINKNYNTKKFNHNLLIPNNAKTGITRIRVVVSNGCYAPSSPCSPSAPNNFEAEDYSLLILPNNLPPVSQFYTPKVNSCSFTAAFIDTSSNSPTSWQWNFGDAASGVNNTSTLQNPSHTYSASGTYTITLTTCKGAACNTAVKTNYITISGNSGPRTFNCSTNTYEINTATSRISGVTMATINQPHPTILWPNNSIYLDQSCSIQTNLIPGRSYPFTINTNNGNLYPSNLRGWIDFNDDGIFDPITETVIQSDNLLTHTGNLSIPNNAVQNKPLRFRLAVDRFNVNTPMPCKHLTYGSILDYAVIITNNTGLQNDPLSQQLKVYPNPSNGTFSLEIPTDLTGSLQVEVQNLLGQTVAKKGLKVADSGVQMLDLKPLPKGVYLLKLNTENGTAVKKIVIE